jgi:transposase-like protein
MGWVKDCQCPYCRCSYPSKPGTSRGSLEICWRCKKHYDVKAKEDANR